MSDLKPPRGTHDILPEEQRRHRHVGDTARDIAALYGYQEMSTPIFESTDVFRRTLGETSDVVTKEMYSFEDKSSRSLTLRPEGTAGVARAFISGLRSEPLPLKLFYQGPMFRYERAQKGRQRQFHQFGVELLGVDGPKGDVEVIAMGAQILEALGVLDKSVLEINTLGDQESRKNYLKVLVDYFERHESGLSTESRDRLKQNPLRILDSKDTGDIGIVGDAPRIEDHLNTASRDFFETVCQRLEGLKTAYIHNPYLVRGLDYYCHTAFEFTASPLGAQNAVLAGGRYDGLIETMGGPSTSGIGWAAGVERLALMIDAPPAPAPAIAVVPIGEAAESESFLLAQRLRQSGHSVHLGYSGNLKKRLGRANKLGAACAVIIGENELAKGAATVRDMKTGEETEVDLSSLEDHLAQFR